MHISKISIDTVICICTIFLVSRISLVNLLKSNIHLYFFFHLKHHFHINLFLALLKFYDINCQKCRGKKKNT